MNELSKVARRRLEMQGFVGHDDATLAEVNLWLRLSPALCMTVAAVGTILASPAILALLVPFALAGALLPGHPFDVVYNHGIRHLIGTRRLPPYRAPRRFACGVASLWLTAAATTLALGATTLGLAMGWAMVLLAGSHVLTGFCVPSFLYGLLFGKVSERSPASA